MWWKWMARRKICQTLPKGLVVSAGTLLVLVLGLYSAPRPGARERRTAPRLPPVMKSPR